MPQPAKEPSVTDYGSINTISLKPDDDTSANIVTDSQCNPTPALMINEAAGNILSIILSACSYAENPNALSLVKGVFAFLSLLLVATMSCTNSPALYNIRALIDVFNSMLTTVEQYNNTQVPMDRTKEGLLVAGGAVTSASQLFAAVGNVAKACQQKQKETDEEQAATSCYRP